MLPCLILGRIGTHSAGRRGSQSFSEHRRSCLCLDDVAYVGGVKVGIFVFNLLLTWHQQNVRNLRILSPLLNGKPRTPLSFAIYNRVDLSQEVIGPTITLFGPPANLAAAIRT